MSNFELPDYVEDVFLSYIAGIVATDPRYKGIKWEVNGRYEVYVSFPHNSMSNVLITLWNTCGENVWIEREYKYINHELSVCRLYDSHGTVLWQESYKNKQLHGWQIHRSIGFLTETKYRHGVKVKVKSIELSKKE